MKLKHLAAFLVLLAVGCTQQPDSEGTAPESGGAATATPDASSAVEPGTETQLASSTVTFDVEGMT